MSAIKSRRHAARAVALAATLSTVAFAGTPARAGRLDPPLAGSFLVTDTHGQPFCADRGSLRDYTLASLGLAPFPPQGFRACAIAPYGARVTVLQDLPPFGSRMHVVRARAASMIQAVEGYTWSVGLYDSRRFSTLIPYGEYFPQFP